MINRPLLSSVSSFSSLVFLSLQNIANIPSSSSSSSNSNDTYNSVSYYPFICSCSSSLSSLSSSCLPFCLSFPCISFFLTSHPLDPGADPGRGFNLPAWLIDNLGQGRLRLPLINLRQHRTTRKSCLSHSENHHTSPIASLSPVRLAR